jgi:hypothetical protein
MSAIAEWYIVPTSRIPGLTSVCQPAKRSLFRAPARDYEAFWQFLHAHATQGDGLDTSGWIMNPLLELLRERFDVPVDEAERHPLCKTIAIDTFLIIEPAVADRWLSGLAAAIADREGLTSYLLDWYGDGPAPSPDDAELHVAGLRYLRDGIAKLTSDSVLLLSIG